MKSTSLIIAIICLAMWSCTTTPNDSSGQATSDNSTQVKGQSTVHDDESQRNILQIAIASEDHTTLAAAVVAAGLEDVLTNAGPLTVFAPTNEAFAALPEGTVENLLKPENKATLARIIKYHAAPGKYSGDMFKDKQRLFMASGHYIEMQVEGDKIKIGDASVLGTAEAANGLVHVIDAVLLPPDN